MTTVNQLLEVIKVQAKQLGENKTTISNLKDSLDQEGIENRVLRTERALDIMTWANEKKEMEQLIQEQAIQINELIAKNLQDYYEIYNTGYEQGCESGIEQGYQMAKKEMEQPKPIIDWFNDDDNLVDYILDQMELRMGIETETEAEIKIDIETLGWEDDMAELEEIDENDEEMWYDEEGNEKGSILEIIKADYDKGKEGCEINFKDTSIPEYLMELINDCEFIKRWEASEYQLKVWFVSDSDLDYGNCDEIVDWDDNDWDDNDCGNYGNCDETVDCEEDEFTNSIIKKLTESFNKCLSEEIVELRFGIDLDRIEEECDFIDNWIVDFDLETITFRFIKTDQCDLLNDVIRFGDEEGYENLNEIVFYTKGERGYKLATYAEFASNDDMLVSFVSRCKNSADLSFKLVNNFHKVGIEERSIKYWTSSINAQIFAKEFINFCEEFCN